MTELFYLPSPKPLNHLHKEVWYIYIYYISFLKIHKKKVLEATNCVLEVGVRLNGLRITRLEKRRYVPWNSKWVCSSVSGGKRSKFSKHSMLAFMLFLIPITYGWTKTAKSSLHYYQSLNQKKINIFLSSLYFTVILTGLFFKFWTKKTLGKTKP